MPTSPISVQPGALLVTSAIDVTVDDLNTQLQPYGLCLPIAPLMPGLTLADLVARNAGGRRRLRYGTIARYLRASTLVSSTSTNADAPAPPAITLGGPTLKRVTGYGLPRALVGNWLAVGDLRDVTLNLRPLPAIRQCLLLSCADLAQAIHFATRLLASGLSLSALAFLAEPAETPLLLVELEGSVTTVERQTAQLAQLALQAGIDQLAASVACWQRWEQQACQHHATTTQQLTVTLPRADLAACAQQAYSIARRYGLTLALGGDVGVGTLQIALTGAQASEATHAATGIYDDVRRRGGTLSTEDGLSPLAQIIWQNEQRRRGIRIDQPQAADAAQPDRFFVPGSGTAFVDRRPHSAVISNQASLLAAIATVVGASHVLTTAEDRACYATDASIAQPSGEPLAVVLPANTAEVSAVARLAAAAGIPLVTRGAGSGLAGGATPTPGSLILALTRMHQLHIDAQQMVAYAHAGTITADLQRAAEAQGLFYPPDPSSQGISTIGGNIACNAGGPRCLKYGVTADYVLGLTAVLADGRVIRVGDGIAAQSPDAGLLQLLIGSEGTLAILAEATLRLIPMPATRRTTLAIFERLADACTTVEAIMASGVLPAGLELMDDTTIAVVEDYLHIGLPRDAGALLLLLADGEPETVAQEATALADHARCGGARTVQVAHNAADEAALWQARRAIAPALARLRPNRLGEDICVPLPQIAHAVQRIKDIAHRYAQPIAVFGHAGDGNLHPNILFDARDAAQVTRTWQAAEAIFALALELGGTLSGEHGIGILKRPFLGTALGPDVLHLQWKMKVGFDPDGQLNPGKVLP